MICKTLNSMLIFYFVLKIFRFVWPQKKICLDYIIFFKKKVWGFNFQISLLQTPSTPPAPPAPPAPTGEAQATSSYTMADSD